MAKGDKQVFSSSFGHLLRKSKLGYCLLCHSVKVSEKFVNLRLNKDKVPVGICSTCYDLRNLLTIPERK